MREATGPRTLAAWMDLGSALRRHAGAGRVADATTAKAGTRRPIHAEDDDGGRRIDPSRRGPSVRDGLCGEGAGRDPRPVADPEIGRGGASKSAMRLAGCFILLLGLAACADRTVPLDPTADTEGENVERPEVGMWAPCASQAECMDAPICVYPADESGFCTQSCETVADCPEAYAPPSNPTCVDLGDELPMCALDCSGGSGCPPQMRCTAVATPGGERKLCF